ncbi:MAG: rhomboid family intramembrane serine protease [Bacteroidota bacterium]
MTIIIVIITVLVSLAALSNRQIMLKLIFNPYAVKKFNQWYRLVSCGLLHADFMHLAINMLVLYSFGNAVEQYYHFAFGNAAPYLFLLMYVSSVFAANVSTLFKQQNNPHYNSLGASGGVSAVLFASIIFNPWAKVYFFGFFPLPGIAMGVVYLAYSYYMTKRDSSDNINHEAHFYGAVYGMLFTIVFKPSLILYFFNALIHF